jgi:GT2 family glycosyltransferase
MKTVSVIMVSFNTGPVLFRSIEAALLQENLHELIIVDNGNSREVRARLKIWTENDARVMLVTGHGNVGFAVGCNLGAAKATGYYLLLLNPDCVAPTGAFSTVISAMEARPEAWLAGCRILNPDGSEQAGSRRNLLTPSVAFVENFRLYHLLPQRSGKTYYFKRMNVHAEEKTEEPAFVPAISGAFMMIARERYYRLGGLDEEYFFHVEDLDFCYQVHEKGGKILFVPEVAPVHYRSTSQVSDIFVEYYKARGFTRYFHKRFKGKYFKGFLELMTAAIYARFLFRAVIVTLQSLWRRKGSVQHQRDDAAAGMSGLGPGRARRQQKAQDQKAPGRVSHRCVQHAAPHSKTMSAERGVPAVVTY